MKKLYVPKEAGDPLSSQDWNSLQEQIQKDLSSHRHTGGDDGSPVGGVDPGALEAGPLLVRSGSGNDGKGASHAIRFGYSNTDRYQHWIRTRHNAKTTVKNAFDVYTSDGTEQGKFPENAVHGLTITDGKVGIGRTAPDAPIDAAGANGIRTRFHSGAGNWAGLRNDDLNAYIETYTVNASKYPQNLILQPAGNVGIGTSAPKARLHAVGDIVLGNDINGQKFILHPRCNGSGDFLYLTFDKPDGNWDWTKSICYGRDGKLGIGAKNTESDTLLLVNGNVRVKGTIQPSSSRALKQNILPLDMPTAIGLFEGLDPVSFEYKEGADGRSHLGFIAEDVPEALAASDGKAVNTLEIIPVLVKTIQELRQRVHRLEQELQGKH